MLAQLLRNNASIHYVQTQRSAKLVSKTVKVNVVGEVATRLNREAAYQPRVELPPTRATSIMTP